MEKRTLVPAKKQSRYQHVVNTVAVGVVAASPLVAFADTPAAPDVSSVVSYLGLAVAAIGAIGAAKMIPAAAMWLWSTLTVAVRRG